MNDQFLSKIIQQFKLDPHGIHGIEHWIRVNENGYRLAQTTGANIGVIQWFAVLHDCRRVSNADDIEHGPRAASFARKHRRDIDLKEHEFDLLTQAIYSHTKGCSPDSDITIQTCLDADRLDITRTGCFVDQAWLYTEAAKVETMRSKPVRGGGNRR